MLYMCKALIDSYNVCNESKSSDGLMVYAEKLCIWKNCVDFELNRLTKVNIRE